MIQMTWMGNDKYMICSASNYQIFEIPCPGTDGSGNSYHSDATIANAYWTERSRHYYNTNEDRLSH